MYRTLAVLLTCQFFLAANAEDWPQWQGPHRNAISTERGLLKEWEEGGPPLAWRIEGLGGGDSAPAVSHGKIFGMSNRGGKEIVWALAEKDGNEVWVSSLGDAVAQRRPQSKEGPGGTPTVDGEHIYVIGMGGRVVCLRQADGTIVWGRSLTEDFGGAVPAWSFRESPLIDGDKLICTPGGPDATLVALDKATGETLWKSKLPATESSESGASARQVPRRTRDRERDQPRGNQARTGRRAPNNNAQPISGTKDAQLFVSEHWGMTEFSQKLPNGKYISKLYFAETYQGITEAGQRVFSFEVQGKTFKDFDVWEKAGGPRKAYIEAVPVEVMDGELKITFTRQVESPAIKAIEIVPQSGDPKDAIRINAGANAVFRDSSGNEWLADTGFKDGSVNPGTVGGRGGRGRSGPRAGAGYSSVISIDVEGQRQYVQLTANALVGIAADDGKFLWRYDRPANRMGINCSTPIFQDGLVFAASAYGNGGGAVKLARQADGGFEAEEVYFTTNMQNHHGGMIVHDGCLYGANGGNGGGFFRASISKPARYCGEIATRRKGHWRSRTSDSTFVRKTARSS